MQVIGVGERRYFNGHSTMTIIIRTANGKEVDMVASVEQVDTVLQYSNMQEAVRLPPTAQAPTEAVAARAATPTLDPFANSMLDDDEVVDDPIRLAPPPVGGFGSPDEGRDDTL